MKKTTLFIILIFSINSNIFCQSPYWLWAESGYSGRTSYSKSLATDSNGNVYITGSFSSDSIRFGNYWLTNFNANHTPQDDIYIVKYNPNGMVLWAIKAGGKRRDIANSIAIDKDGHLYITGFFNSDTLTFGKIKLSNYKGQDDIFIAKYDLNGNALWAVIGGGFGSEGANGITVSSDGYIYLTGSFTSPKMFFGSFMLIKKSIIDVFIIKLDTSGKIIWGRNANDGNGNCIKTDEKNNIYVTGSFSGTTITFGSFTLTNAGGNDIFIVKYDPAGNVKWVRRSGGNDRDDGLSLDINKFGQIYLGGRFYSSKITFGTFNLNNQGISNLFLTKYDSIGNTIWATSTGGKTSALLSGLVTDTSGDVIITGYYWSPSIRFGNYYLFNSSVVGIGNTDIFVAKYDTSGFVKWAISPYGRGMEISNYIGIDTYQNIFILGEYLSSEIHFCQNILDSTSGWEVFVSKLSYCSLPKPIISIIGDTTFCQGDSVMLSSSSNYGNFWSDSSNNKSLAVKKSGIYSVTVTDSFCCSSTSAKLNIKVLPKPSIPSITLTGDTIFCKGDSVILTSSKANAYLWSDSTKYNSISVKKSGNYFVTISDSLGCKANSPQVNIRVHPTPVADFNINQNPQPLVGNNFIFSNTSSLSTGSKLTYFWDFGDGNNSTDTSTTHNYTLAGSYNVKLITISDSGCTDTLTVTVLVLLNPGLVVSFTVQNACVGEEVIFKNTSTIIPPDSFLNFLWDFGDGSTIVKKEPKHIYTSAGKYIIRLVALTAFGLKDTLIDTIEIFIDPVVNITASPDTIVITGFPVTLTATGLYDQLLWFNNSTNNPVTVLFEGKYWVTASYNNGCTSSDTIILTKGEIKEPEPVNVITPNGDGFNDKLVIKNIDLIKPCKISIYNRWGDELYASSDYQNNWEGTYKGKKLPEGTYYYVLVTKDGKVYRGAVNILK